MKKLTITTYLLVQLLLVSLFTGTSSASPQAKIIKPTSSSLGKEYLYKDSSMTPDLIIGGGGTDLNMALQEDGQFALLDPHLPGPGTSSLSSILILDYQKNTICEGAQINDVKVNAIWKSSELSADPMDFAIIGQVSENSGVSSVSLRSNTSSGELSYISPIFGGIIKPKLLSSGQAFDGIVKTSLSHDSSSVQSPMNRADLNNPDSRIIVSLGRGGSGDFINISGYLDYIYLEVSYDDAGCHPDSVAISDVKPPKTGSFITISIILASTLASIGASLTIARRLGLKRGRSERE